MLSFTEFWFCRAPLFLRLIFSTTITSLWPVDFPLKILISGNLTGFQFIHSNHPFFQKIIQNPIIKPHTDRSMSRPAIIVVVVNGSVSYFIAFFTRKFSRKKQMQGWWILCWSVSPIFSDSSFCVIFRNVRIFFSFRLKFIKSPLH